MKLLLLIIACTTLLSCNGDAINVEKTGDFKLEFLFEKDGCKMYRFYDGGRYIYWSNCTGKSEYSYTYRAGKATVTKKLESITNK